MINSPSVVRRIWENSESYTNSYLAVEQAIPEAARSNYWTSFLASLWNVAPYATYYKTIDGLAATVSPETIFPISVTTPGKEFTYQLSENLETGAARYFHFTFPDSSVHSLTVLNGLAYKLSLETLPDGAADKYYLYENAGAEQAQGATIVLLMKVAGQDWQLVNMSRDPAYSHCMDIRGKIEDLVIIQSNADFEHPDRIIQPQGLNTTLFASDLPCYQYSGTSMVTKVNDGVERTAVASKSAFASLHWDPISAHTKTFTMRSFQRACSTRSVLQSIIRSLGQTRMDVLMTGRDLSTSAQTRAAFISITATCPGEVWCTAATRATGCRALRRRLK